MSTPIQPPEPVAATFTHPAESGAKIPPQPAAPADIGSAGAGSSDAAALSALLALIECRASELSDAGRNALLRRLGAIERCTRPVQAARAWSLDPTRGDASRWPAVWAQCMPRWLAHGKALGLTHRETYCSDEFRGPRRDLVALGIVAEGDFPGDAGRGLSMVTYAEDGRPKRKGEGNTQRQAAMRVARSGAGFVVEVFPPRAVRDQRWRQEYGQDEEAARSIAESAAAACVISRKVDEAFAAVRALKGFNAPSPSQPRSGLRLVYSRTE